jgi:hypothetical protein
VESFRIQTLAVKIFLVLAGSGNKFPGEVGVPEKIELLPSALCRGEGKIHG